MLAYIPNDLLYVFSCFGSDDQLRGYFEQTGVPTVGMKGSVITVYFAFDEGANVLIDVHGIYGSTRLASVMCDG